MKFIIREYIFTLKESGELDVLVPDLLFAMGFTLISKPQRGVRQDGVDVAAIGNDNGQKKLFLFLIKSGDLTRTDWNAPNQGVRDSLNDILDKYINTHIDINHKKLPIKIVLCCGGSIQQEVEENWSGFKKSARRSKKYKNIEFDEWRGEKLAVEIERCFFRADLLPKGVQNNLRRTLSLLNDSDYDARHYYQMIEDILFDTNVPDAKKRKKAVKSILLLKLCMLMIFKLAQDEDNLNVAFLIAERTLLRTWDFIVVSNLINKSAVMSEFNKLYLAVGGIMISYINKIAAHCFVRDGLFGYSSAEEVEYPLRTLSVIGKIATSGLIQFHLYQHTKDNIYFKNAEAIANILIGLIDTNHAAFIPLYDGHGIDICLGLLLLTYFNHITIAINWVHKLCISISNGYTFGAQFPISTDSFDDLLKLKAGEISKESLMNLSTLMPMLIEWCALLGASETYEKLKNDMEKLFFNTHQQIWHPDENTDKYFYKTNASLNSGVTKEMKRLPESANELLEIIKKYDIEKETNLLSSYTKQYSGIGFVASRHFRTPVMPYYWRMLASLVVPKRTRTTR